MIEWTISDGSNSYTYESAIDDTYLTSKIGTAQPLTLRDRAISPTAGGGGAGYGSDYGQDYGNPSNASGEASVQQLLKWVRYSDHVHYGTKNDGTGWFHENPPGVGPSSNFVLITPPDTVNIPPFYAVIEDGEDQTPGHGNPRIIRLSIVWLAPASQYADRSAAVADLEA